MKREKKSKVELQTCRVCKTQYPRHLTQCTCCKIFNLPENAGIGEDNTVILANEESAVKRMVLTGPWDNCWGTDVDEKGNRKWGAVSTAVNLVGGAPGAGKSTLSLQMADNVIHTTNRETLYFAAEEATADIRSRAKRIGLKHLDKFRLLPMGKEGDIGGLLEKYKPAMAFFDSLPTFAADPAEQVEFCNRLKPYAVALDCPMFVIDHITKGEELAGLMALQHAVDGTFSFVVYDNGLRELKPVKNRNGSTDQVVFFEMTEKHGLLICDPDEYDDKEDEEEEDE